MWTITTGVIKDVVQILNRLEDEVRKEVQRRLEERKVAQTLSAFSLHSTVVSDFASIIVVQRS